VEIRKKKFLNLAVDDGDAGDNQNKNLFASENHFSEKNFFFFGRKWREQRQRERERELGGPPVQ
jgi:hypothetical protein